MSEADARRAPKLPLRLMADSVRSMMNIGSMLRTCDAFAVEEMILAGISGRPPHPEISKTALGADRTVSWRHVEDAVEEARRLSEEGWTLCALEQAHNSVELQRFRVEEGKKYVVIVGNEVEGVDQRLVDLSEAVLEIPQMGAKHSLNVSVSASIALWHFFHHLI